MYMVVKRRRLAKKQNPVCFWRLSLPCSLFHVR